ncbi:hypothetical protein P389DRAFT_173892 [Cystobasidium minutum MCA 4210]|uniref:uncharacterized protein n=1 Tax=Cystobasidium minutum MCA 4210 TaxID=1397322 RepID=UPI0034CF377E|eukprot:jgi/Rhomi1/173892/fgenesh1_kg.6_\
MTAPAPGRSIDKQADDDGQFRRQEAVFRQKSIAPEDAEKGRYIIYANYLCPWAGRTLITRSLKRLEDYIDVSILDYELGENGWFWSGRDGTDEVDPVNGFKYIKEVYHSVDPNYSARFTIPVLYDKKLKTIVNNESSEIIRILNTFPRAADAATDNIPDLYPEHLRGEIDNINEPVYNNVNNRVYRAGFATKQAAYDEHVTALFEMLEQLEELLSGAKQGTQPRKYLCGQGKGQFTEADLRLYMTLARFDMAYYGIFRCNIKRIKDYPHLHRYFVNLYNKQEFKKWTNFYHIKAGYAGASRRANDQEVIVPAGPSVDDVL